MMAKRSREPKTNEDSRYWVSMRAAEVRIIESYLEVADGNVQYAADMMGMDKAWLYRRMRKLGIDKPKPKREPRAEQPTKAVESPPEAPEAFESPDPEPDTPMASVVPFAPLPPRDDDGSDDVIYDEDPPPDADDDDDDNDDDDDSEFDDSADPEFDDADADDTDYDDNDNDVPPIDLN